MRGIYNILKFEMNLISKEFAIIMTLFLGPILYPLWVGSVYEKKNIDSTPIGIVDMDGTQTSRTLSRFLDASPKITIAQTFTSYQEGLDALNSFENFGFVLIPKGFEAELKKGKGSDLSAYMNTTRFLPASDVLQGIQEVTMTMGAGIRMKTFAAKGMPNDIALKKAIPIQPEIRKLYNSSISYGDYILPAVFFLVIQQTLLMGIGQSMSVMREDNRIGELSRISQGSAVKAFWGRGIFYMGLFLAYGFLICLLLFPLFNLSIHGSGLQFWAFIVLFIFSIAALGTLLGSFFKTQSFWMIFAAFTSYPLFLGSGYVWPMYDMPIAMKVIASTFPSTPFFQGMQKISQMNASWSSVSHHFVHLLILSLIIFIACIWRLNYLFKKA